MPEYIVKRLILRRKSLCLLCASGASGKTFFAQYVASCVASGTDLFGQFPVQQTNVLHLDQERNDDLAEQRYSRIWNWLGLDDPGVAIHALPTRLDVVNNWDKSLADLVELFSGFGLIVIDSLKKISIEDENSSAIERVMDLLRQAAQQANTCIVLIHHKGKSKDAKQSGRGHSSIYDSVDTQIDLDKRADSYSLVCAKARATREFEPVSYEMIDAGEYFPDLCCTNEVQFIATQTDATAASSEETDIRELILELIKKHGSIIQSELYDLVGGKRSLFTKAIDDLLRLGKMEESRGARNARHFSLAK